MPPAIHRPRPAREDCASLPSPVDRKSEAGPSPPSDPLPILQVLCFDTNTVRVPGAPAPAAKELLRCDAGAARTSRDGERDLRDQSEPPAWIRQQFLRAQKQRLPQ